MAQPLLGKKTLLAFVSFLSSNVPTDFESLSLLALPNYSFHLVPLISAACMMSGTRILMFLVIPIAPGFPVVALYKYTHHSSSFPKTKKGRNGKKGKGIGGPWKCAEKEPP